MSRTPDLIDRWFMGTPGIDHDLCVSTRFGRRSVRDLDADLDDEASETPDIDHALVAALFDDPREVAAA